MAIDANAANGSHGSAALWLDVADRVIKFLALLVGAAWTWMHYTRSRTYAKKLELGLEASIFVRDGLYLEVAMRLENLGAARHPVQERGTSCTVWAVMDNLSRVRLFAQTAFETESWIEPGESIHDSKVFKIEMPREGIVWLMVNLRVESEDREWRLTRHVRVEIVE